MSQIRIGRFDGEQYGIGFTNDDGATWETAISFDGGHLGSLTYLDIEEQLSAVRVVVTSSKGTTYNADSGTIFTTLLTANVHVGTVEQTDPTGFAFQWQESNDDGATWTNIIGGTSATLQYNASASKMVRCMVTK